MKRKVKKKAKTRRAEKIEYKTVTLHFTREQKEVLDTIAEWSGTKMDDVVSVLLGVAMFMGRNTAVVTAAPQVAPDGEPPAPAPQPDAPPAPPPDDPAPSSEAQP